MIKSRKIGFWIASTLLISGFQILKAQPGQQLWLEWQVDYPFANKYLIENTVAYQTLLSGGEKWRSFSLDPTFEYSITPKIDLLSDVPIGWTRQNNTVSSFEVSPIVGARFYLSQGKRIDARILTRFQSRNFHQIEGDVWEHKGRFRLKGEVWISVNGPNLFADKLLYAVLDYEEFIVVDQQVNERYAYQRRARVGLGYRLNYRDRLDLFYTWQQSRDEVNGDFVQNDGIIQVKYKLYFNPASTATK